jgi:phage portal protein BeeE
MPYFRRIEQNISKWLLSPADRGRFFARFNVDALLRADTAGRGAFYVQMLQNGVFSRNEVRALENREKIDGLDEYTIQLNMTTVEQLLFNSMQARSGGGTGNNNEGGA